MMTSESNYYRSRLVAASTVAVLFFVGCVDLTEPWKHKVTDAGGSSGGAGGTRIEVGEGEAGGGDIDAAAGGAGGAIDGGWAGAGGAVDLGSGGAGGAIDLGAGGTIGNSDAPMDLPISGSGGMATGGNSGIDGSATGGKSGGTGGKATGGTAGGSGGRATGGATGGTGGATRTGGSIGTGGTSGSGGATGTGGTSAPDAGPDVPPDTSTLANGLLAYYPCESASGSTLPDMSGNGNNATLSASGSYSLGPGGKVGNALTLIKNQSGYVAMPPAMFGGLTQITIATWVKIVTATNWQRLFDIGINAGLSINPLTGTNTVSYMNFVPQTAATKAIFGITKTGYSAEQDISTGALSAGTWRHVAIVLSGGTGTLYIDGGSPTSNTSMTLLPAGLGTIDYAFIGRSQFSVDPYFDGTVDEFRVYNRALSAAEVLALYNFTGS